MELQNHFPKNEKKINQLILENVKLRLPFRIFATEKVHSNVYAL